MGSNGEKRWDDSFSVYCVYDAICYFFFFFRLPVAQTEIVAVVQDPNVAQDQDVALRETVVAQMEVVARLLKLAVEIFAVLG